MKKQNKTNSSMGIIFGVAFVWFTTHFGGGFASGAQMFQYYMGYGLWALVLPILAIGYDAIYFAYALHFARKHELYDYRSYNDYFYGRFSKIFSNLFEILYLVVMLLPPAVAFATGGATMAAVTGLPYIVCTLIIGIFIFVTAVYGTVIVRKVATVVSVLIIVGLFIVYIPNIIAQWDTITANMAVAAETSFTGKVAVAAFKSAFIYGTFQLTNIAAFVQHAESFDKPKDSLLCTFFGWIINFMMMIMCTLGMFSLLGDDSIFSVSIPVLVMVENGVGASFMTPLISTLIILGAVSTAVNMVASMTKRIQGALEDPAITKAAAEKNKPTKVAIIATLVCCIVDFSVAQFGLITLVSKGYSFLAYLAIPIITIPYIVHMIATKFDSKNPPRLSKVDAKQE